MAHRFSSDPEGRVANMGPVQGGLRILAGTLLAPAALAAVRFLPIDWAFTLVLHGLATSAYLLMTGVGRFDPFFGALTSMWAGRRRAPRAAQGPRAPAVIGKASNAGAPDGPSPP